MISVDVLLYKIDFKLNKLTTLTHQEIPLENKILALREGQIALIKSKVNPGNKYNLGFDSFKKRYEDLEVLVEQAHDHPLDLALVDDKLNKWNADLAKLLPKYMFYVDSYAIADKGKCKDHIIWVNHDLTKHSDVATLTANNNYKPSFEYQETFDTLSNNKLELYTDGTFDYTKVFVSYLRYPKPIDQVGYINFDETPSIKQDCELPDYLEDELVNFTIKELGFDTENETVIKASPDRIGSDE